MGCCHTSADSAVTIAGAVSVATVAFPVAQSSWMASGVFEVLTDSGGKIGKANGIDLLVVLDLRREHALHLCCHLLTASRLLLTFCPHRSQHRLLNLLKPDTRPLSDQT